MSVMRRLFLLRHAEADRPANTPDHLRPLTQRGMQDALAMGGYMAQEGLLPQLAVVSTATRTRGTWEQVQKQLPGLVPAIFESRVYECQAADILNVIRATAPEHHSLMVVGHNPGMQTLALRLVGHAVRNAFSRLGHDFPPGALAVVDFELAGWNDIADHGGTLERFATPSD